MAEPNQLYNFGRVHHEGQVCEIIVHFGSLVQEKKSFKGISKFSGAFGDPLFSGVEPFVQN